MKTKSKYISFSLLFFVLVITLLSSCAKRVHPYFDMNVYLNDFNNYVINDSLNLLHKTYGNIEFIDNRNDLKELLRNDFGELNNVLIFGTGENFDYSLYSYAILLNPKNTKYARNELYYSRDTIIGKNKFVMIANGRKPSDPKEVFAPDDSDIIYVDDNYDTLLPSIYNFRSYCSQSSDFYNCLNAYLDYPIIDDSTEYTKLQFQLNYSSFLGNNTIYRNLLSKWDNKTVSLEVYERVKEESTKGWQKIKQELLFMSDTAQIIMFSENHFKPKHRKTLTLLLPELRKQGYSYLALEALSEEADSLLNNGSHVLNSMGYYTREQNYIELLETAQELGFEFVSYDDFSQKDRELAQADNIYLKTIKKNPQAKVIVLAGFGHIREEANDRGILMMAGHLKHTYGLDPITVTQTAFTRYAYQGNEMVLLESNLLPEEFQKSTDYTLNVPDGLIENKDYNYSYTNRRDFAVQLSIYKADYLNHNYSYSNLPPSKAFLLENGETYQTTLDNGTTYKYYIIDEKGRKLEEKLIPRVQ